MDLRFRMHPGHAAPGPVGARNALWRPRHRLEARPLFACACCCGRSGQLEPHRQYVQDQGRESHAAKSRAKLAQEAATLIEAAAGPRFSRRTLATWSVSSSCARQRLKVLKVCVGQVDPARAIRCLARKMSTSPWSVARCNPIHNAATGCGLCKAPHAKSSPPDVFGMPIASSGRPEGRV